MLVPAKTDKNRKKELARTAAERKDQAEREKAIQNTKAQEAKK